MTPLRLLRPTLRPAAAAARSQFHSSSKPPSWFNWLKGGDKAAEDKPQATKAAAESRNIADLLKQSPRTASKQEYAPPKVGDLDESSIFAEDGAEAPAAGLTSRDIDITAIRKLQDPQRDSWGWPKKAAQRDIRRRGRLSRPQLIAQTEKEHVAKSHFFKTSYKKLMMVANQIQGKTLDDAITQMRFSPKKAARDVLGHLHHAKNEAIVRKDMDPKEMYVNQAWVGRGPYEKEYSHRAKGRIDILRKPYASVTVQFKEQKTLQRIQREKDEKRLRKAPWQPLPSRPLYGQRQYYQW